MSHLWRPPAGQSAEGLVRSVRHVRFVTFEDRHGASGAGQREGRAESSRAPTDHDHIGRCGHACTLPAHGIRWPKPPPSRVGTDGRRVGGRRARWTSYGIGAGAVFVFVVANAPAAVAAAGAGSAPPGPVPLVSLPPIQIPGLPPITVPVVTLPRLPVVPSPTVPRLPSGPAPPPRQPQPPVGRPTLPTTVFPRPARSTVLPVQQRPLPRGARTATYVPRSAVTAANDGVTPGVAAPQLALQSAKDLSVPFGVGAAVTVFLVIQGRIDRRDPKLSDAPVGSDEDLVEFA
jgi:hypothetical protein